MNWKSIVKIIIRSPILGGVTIPYLIARERIQSDIKRWRSLNQTSFKNDYLALLDLLTRHVEFRNIYYVRYRRAARLSFLLPPLSSLYITCHNIGKGFFVQHGFSTVITAKKIGDNFWVNQQVTIGYTAKGSPTIGSNVRIGAGAIVVGDIVIGNNVTIAAGATVNMDVPDNSLVVPQKARIIENHIVSKQ